MDNHLCGNQCPKCSGVYRPDTEEWIKRSWEAHGNFYDYSKSTYRSAHDKIIITCPNHGDFEQLAGVHARGFKCVKCAHEQGGLNQRLSNEEFIERAKNIHEGRYNYDRTNYTVMTEKVTITCLVHGDYKQSPINHLEGNGCSSCAPYGFRAAKPGRFYTIELVDDLTNRNYVKIGISNNTVEQRFSGLPQTTQIARIIVNDWYETGQIALDRETLLKRELAPFLTEDRGFMGSAGGYSEIYEPDVLTFLTGSETGKPPP